MHFGDSPVSRLAVGTAQFGMPYGVANTRGIIPAPEAHAILDMATSAGITCVDTAPAYGSAEEVVGAWLRRSGRGLRIVSKFIAGAADPVTAAKETLVRLSASSLHGLLLHHFDDFLRSPAVWDGLRAARDSGLTAHIGFSLYTPDQARQMLDAVPDVGIVQVPYSILDRRLEPFIRECAARGIEVHVRSVFLQGLLFMDDTTLAARFPGARSSVAAARRMASAQRISLEALGLGFALAHRGISAVVVGLDGLDHCRAMISAASAADAVGSIRNELDDCMITDENILLPYRWRNA